VTKLSEFEETFIPEFLVELKGFVNSYFTSSFHELNNIFQYHLGLNDPIGKQGKHIRPLLTLLCCAGTEKDWKIALPAAISIELIHNFSLIHDDIEDNGLIRRGKDTVWNKWGLPQALNAGDAMFTAAFSALFALKEQTSGKITLDAAKLLTDTCQRLTEGQYLDIDFEEQVNVSREDYLKMIKGKTAALISCSTRMGALTGGFSIQEQIKYEKFGEALGIAFQIYDDWLGIWGDAEFTGKSVTSDIVDQKKTLPIIIGLENSSQFSCLFNKNEISEDQAILMANQLKKDGIEELVITIYQTWTEKAFLALKNMDCNEDVRSSLNELTNKLLIRKK
jgi:geranylgeranyl diphosphate synthase, type I